MDPQAGGLPPEVGMIWQSLPVWAGLEEGSSALILFVWNTGWTRLEVTKCLAWVPSGSQDMFFFFLFL